jgi:hypothetical protein
MKLFTNIFTTGRFCSKWFASLPDTLTVGPTGTVEDYE